MKLKKKCTTCLWGPECTPPGDDAGAATPARHEPAGWREPPLRRRMRYIRQLLAQLQQLKRVDALLLRG